MNFLYTFAEGGFTFIATLLSLNIQINKTKILELKNRIIVTNKGIDEFK